MDTDIDDTWIHPNTNSPYLYSLGGNDVTEADGNLAVDRLCTDKQRLSRQRLVVQV
jgi:hypothetical protein